MLAVVRHKMYAAVMELQLRGCENSHTLIFCYIMIFIVCNVQSLLLYRNILISTNICSTNPSVCY